MKKKTVIISKKENELKPSKVLYPFVFNQDIQYFKIKKIEKSIVKCYVYDKDSEFLRTEYRDLKTIKQWILGGTGLGIKGVKKI